MPPHGDSLYAELKALAQRKLRAESSADLLQPTALVNEAWLRRRGGQPVICRTATFPASGGAGDATGTGRPGARDQGSPARPAMRSARHPHLADPRRRVAIEWTTNLLDVDGARPARRREPRCAEALDLLHYFGGMNLRRNRRGTVDLPSRRQARSRSGARLGFWQRPRGTKNMSKSALDRLEDALFRAAHGKT